MENKSLESKLSALVPVISELFTAKHNNKAAAVKSDDLVFHIKASGYPNSLRSQDIRAIVGYIRHHDLLAPAFILSNVHSGYWLSTDKAEMRAYVDQELDRMGNQFGNIKALHQRIRGGGIAKPAIVQEQLL